MKRKNKYGKPDSELFLRYFKGEMTESERNSFEKELQRNPFAQEALEGMETINARDVRHDLVFLEQKIRRRLSRRRYLYYRIAASVAVLMIISSVFYVVERSRISEQDSIQIYRQVPMDIAKAEPVRKPDAEDQKESQPSTAPTSRQKKVQTQAVQDAATQDLAGDVSTEPEKIDPVKEMQLPAQKRFVNQMPVMAEEAAAAQPSAMNRSLTKYDTGITENAIIEKAVTVEITTGNTERKDIIAETVDYSPPQPLPGKAEYERYIRENTLRPDSATVGQRVVVVAAFKVLGNGLLDSIRIIMSPDQSFSDEALRLIRSAPAWKPATLNGTPVEEEVRLRIVFR